MSKCKLLLSVITAVNVLSTLVFLSFGPRFYHVISLLHGFGLIADVKDGITKVPIEKARIVVIFILLLILLYAIIRIMLLRVKKIRISKVLSWIISIDSAIDAIFCLVFTLNVSINNNVLDPIQEEFGSLTPCIISFLIWGIVLISLIVVKVRFNREDAVFNFIIGLYIINMIIFVFVWLAIVIKFKIMMMSYYYSVTFTFVEDVILIMLLTMYRKELDKSTINQKDNLVFNAKPLTD